MVCGMLRDATSVAYPAGMRENTEFLSQDNPSSSVIGIGDLTNAGRSVSAS
jgi:hypothetical protein